MYLSSSLYAYYVTMYLSMYLYANINTYINRTKPAATVAIRPARGEDRPDATEIAAVKMGARLDSLTRETRPGVRIVNGRRRRR